MIPKDEYDAAMEAYERAEFYRKNPAAAEHEALVRRLGEMEANPDRLNNYEGEQNIRGASDRNEEYMTINSGEKGMYAGSINNAKRKEMARMMHDAEDLQTFEEDEKYADYIRREREKIGTVYKDRDDFNHRIVARLKRLEINKPDVKDEADNISVNTDSQSNNQIDETLGLPGPVLGETLGLPGPVLGEEDQPNDNKKDEDTGNKVEVGEINIEGIEQQFEDDRTERMTELEEKLDKIMPDIAELYARNRRLVVGAENRANFVKVQGEYSKLLDEYLRLKAGEVHDAGERKNAERISARIEELRADIEGALLVFAGGNFNNTEKTQEEIDEEKQRLILKANEILKEEYGEWTAEVKEDVDAAFLEELLNQQKKLEEATIDKLDNGSICRKFVNKVINNKVLKGVLVGAAVAGLAVTGVGLVAGLATGAMTIGLGFTAGGVASGALKGGLGGLIMSRQNSKNSAVRGFVDEDKIKEQIERIDLSKENPDVSNVSEWLIGQYNSANIKDRRSNQKKTALSVGIGAALGAFASGIKINNVSTVQQTETVQTGTTPIEYNVDANLAQVNQPYDTGLYETMRQMGVPQDNWERALEIAYRVEPSYGLSPGSNGVHAGFNGVVGRLAEAYPGPIDTWPSEARSFITEVAREWAREGLMPSIRTGGEPIYSTITRTVTEYIPNAFLNFLARTTATIGAGAIGGRVAGSTTVDSESSAPVETEPEPVTPIEAEPVQGAEPVPTETQPTPTEIEPTPIVAEPTSINGVPVGTEGASAPSAEVTPADNTNEVAPETTAEAAPTQPETDNSAEEWNDLGREFLTSEEGLSEEYADRISEWWAGLSEDLRNDIREYFDEVSANNPHGRALREWLSLQ